MKRIITITAVFLIIVFSIIMISPAAMQNEVEKVMPTQIGCFFRISQQCSLIGNGALIKKRHFFGIDHVFEPGGADSSVLLDMFAKFWSIQKEQHGNKPLLVIYANTSNEFVAMPKHVKAFCKYIEQKYNIVIDLHIVRAKTN